MAHSHAVHIVRRTRNRRNEFAKGALDKKGLFVCHITEAGAHKKKPLPPTRLTQDEVKSIYEGHGAALAAYACSLGLDFASAEDVVHQLFLKMLGENSFTPRNPLAYLYRATRNASLNVRRDRRRETDLQNMELWFVHPSRSRDETLNLQRALRELPEEQQETVFLKVWSGMTLLEIAEATETPLNTVASRYRYALEKLRERLGRHFLKRG
jgi:RNA polymerase sigma-70 factor, ECF subfamily